jgi:opacity protein-like surface antigen
VKTCDNARFLVRALLFIVACTLTLTPSVVHAEPRPDPRARATDDLTRARVLDREGAKAYSEGRYNDAIRFFEEAHRLGGPPFELWNIAKCHVQLDQPEQAAEVLERYLATPSLSTADRNEAVAQLEALRARPSTVSVASSPPGARIVVDGRPIAGLTPTSFSVPPGSHTLEVSRTGYPSDTRSIEAKYGRAIILEVPLAATRRTHDPPPPAHGSRAVEDPHASFVIRGHVGATAPRFGGVGGQVSPAFLVGADYRFAGTGSVLFSVGLLFSFTRDSWDNTVGASAVAAPCGTLQTPTSASALSGFLTGSAGVRLSDNLRVRGLGGMGLAAYFASDLGGDVFASACHPAPAARGAFLLGGAIDYSLSSRVHVSLLPALLQLQPAFEGARRTPVDASGTWIRFAAAVGVGVEFE